MPEQKTISMTGDFPSASTLTPSQVECLHRMMDRGDSFISNDVERCRQALVDSCEVQSFDSHLSGAVTASRQRFSNPRYVGCGAFGIVFFVHDEALGMDVAIKLLRPSRNSAIVQQRFLEEAKITASLSHPGIIRLYDSGTINAIPYITSTKASGGSLADLLRLNAGGLNPRLACELMIQVADAVAFAHSKATFHRDLKPGNILLEADTAHASQLRTIVSDFGLAKRWNHSSADDSLTLEGDVLGTARYMSPEQARGDLNAFAITSEVFTLGIILYELLTDQLPFEGDSNTDILRKIVELDPERPRAVRKDVPRDLEAIVLQCLQKAPEDRYDSVASLARDLRRFQNGEPVEAARPSVWRRARWRASEHPVVSTLVAMSMVTLCLSLIGISLAWWRQAQASQREFQTKMDYVRLFGSLIDDVVMGETDQPTVLLESLAKFQTSVEQDLASNARNLKLRHLLSLLLNYQAVILNRTYRHSEGVIKRIDSVAILKQLRDEYPQNPKIRFQYIYGMMDLITSLNSHVGTVSEVRQYCQQHLGFSSVDQVSDNMLVEIVRMQREFPDETDYVSAGYQYRMDILYHRWPQDPESTDRLIDDVALPARQLAQAHPDKLLYRKTAISAAEFRSSSHLSIGNKETALQYADEALRVFNEDLRPHMHLAWVRTILLNIESTRIEALLANSRFDEAYAESCQCMQWIDDVNESLEATQYRLTCMRYIASEKLGKREGLEQLRAELTTRFRAVPKGDYANKLLEWSKRIGLSPEALARL